MGFAPRPVKAATACTDTGKRLPPSRRPFSSWLLRMKIFVPGLAVMKGKQIRFRIARE
jgi:hypothetical protein